ncbi:MAG: sulfotransferase domain-containing protein [bacterium]
MLRFRLLTSSIRIFPEFIIIGGQRCGSTSLYYYLAEYPSIVPAMIKEVHYFDTTNHRKGMKWYRAHFPSLPYMKLITCLNKRQQSYSITGEATPYYMFHPSVPERIKEAFPSVKLIAILRNPVDRAYSHYYHTVRHGEEHLSFEDAIQQETERLQGEFEKFLQDDSYYSFNHQRFSYLSRGIYVEQLKRWWRYFPREQLLILKSEDFFDDSSGVLRKVLAFLGLPDTGWEVKVKTRCQAGRYPKMNPSTKKYLLEYFEPYNQELYELTGIRFD